LANAAILMFQKNPLLGVGLNNFLSNLPLFLSQKNYLLIQPVHNIYLLVLSELGIIGFFFFLILLFFSLRTILKNKNLVVAVLLFEVLFLGLFDHYFLTLQQGQLLFALIIGLSFSKKLLI
jgi:O-antigen ligase